MSPIVSEKSAEGNTITSASKRQGLAKRWCFTWNNYPDNWLSLLSPKFEGLQWIAGQEVGESGTPHIQGYVESDSKIRPIEFFKLPKQIHWGDKEGKACKGDRAANVKYCSKDGKYTGSLSKFVQKPLKLLDPNQFYDWQKDIVDIVTSEPDDRTVHWYWETTGNVGKSALVKYLCAKHGALICSGKSADIKYLILKYHEKHGCYPETIIYDIPRTQQSFVSWTGIEEIKNGCFASTKYECDMILMNSPHIICFANFEPNRDVISADRWHVVEL